MTESTPSIHTPVLLHEVVEGLGTPRVYLDGTLGGAGHMLAMAQHAKGKLIVIGLDRDPAAIKRARTLLEGKAEQVILEHTDFRNLDLALDAHSIKEVDALLLDLGISSDELDASGKGFSFLRDEPLFMTMGDPKEQIFTARDIVNTWEEETIADVIFGYGEERYARRIARNIINYRAKKLIETTFELCEIIKMSVPGMYRHGKIHPATRTFQALRIAVNDELGALKSGLRKGYDRLSSGGRMAIISFHSLEDRIVKDFNKARATEGALIITKKPITASPEERAVNPRSRSAKLRILVKP